MGIQNITTPAYASGNSVLNDDVAGIVVSAPINEMVGITAFWARPYNDNYTGYDRATAFPATAPTIWTTWTPLACWFR